MRHLNKCWLFVKMLCCHTHALAEARDVWLLHGQFVNQNARFEAPVAVSTDLLVQMKCSLVDRVYLPEDSSLLGKLFAKLPSFLSSGVPSLSDLSSPVFVFRLKQSCLRLQSKVLSSSSGSSSLNFIFTLKKPCLHLQAQAVLTSPSRSSSLDFVFRLKLSCLQLQAQAVLSSSSGSGSLVFIFRLKKSFLHLGSNSLFFIFTPKQSCLPLQPQEVEAAWSWKWRL